MVFVVCNPCRACRGYHKMMAWEEIFECQRRQINILREAILRVRARANAEDAAILTRAIHVTDDPGTTQVSGGAGR